LQETVDGLALRNTALAQQADALRNRCAALETEANHLEASINQIRQHAQDTSMALTMQHEQQLRDMASQHSAAVSQKEAAHAEAMSALQTEHQQVVQQLQQQHARQVQALQLQHQHQVQATGQQVRQAHKRALEQQESQMRSKHLDEMAHISDQHQRQLRQLAEQHRTSQANLEQQHVTMMQAAQEQHLQQLSELQATHEAEVTAPHEQLQEAKIVVQQLRLQLMQEAAGASTLHAQVDMLAAACDRCTQHAAKVEEGATVLSAQVSQQQLQLAELPARAVAHEQPPHQLLHLLDLAEEQDCAASSVHRELLEGYQALVESLRSQVAAQKAEAAECGRVLKRGRAPSLAVYTAPSTPSRPGGTGSSTGAGEDLLMVSGGGLPPGSQESTNMLSSGGGGCFCRMSTLCIKLRAMLPWPQMTGSGLQICRQQC
jgi:chromosome segregation ATPase